MRNNPTQKRSAQSMSPTEVKATKKKKKDILVGRKLEDEDFVVAKETPEWACLEVFNADILRNMKTDPKLTVLCKKVRTIRA